MRKRLALLGFLLLGQVANVVAALHMLWCIATDDPHARTIALGYDQLGNTGLGGVEDETISSRAGRAARKRNKWACKLCKLFDRFDKDHCERSIERQFLRKKPH